MDQLSGMGVRASCPGRLAEVKASDIDGDGDDERKAEAKAGQLAEIDALVKRWTAKMDDPNIVDTVAAKLAELNVKRKAIAAELAEIRHEAATPVPQAWREFQSLADLLRKDHSDELRLRVRAALRRAIEGVTCLFVARGGARLAAVRVQFAGSGAHRDYLILHRKRVSCGKAVREAETRAVSFAAADGLDLRDRKDAAKLLRVLERMDLSSVLGGPTRRRSASGSGPKTSPLNPGQFPPGDHIRDHPGADGHCWPLRFPAAARVAGSTRAARRTRSSPRVRREPGGHLAGPRCAPLSLRLSLGAPMLAKSHKPPRCINKSNFFYPKGGRWLCFLYGPGTCNPGGLSRPTPSSSGSGRTGPRRIWRRMSRLAARPPPSATEPSPSRAPAKGDLELADQAVRERRQLGIAVNYRREGGRVREGEGAN